MNKALSLLLVLACFSVSASQAQEPQQEPQRQTPPATNETPETPPAGPHFAFADNVTEYDFGRVPHNSKEVEHRFDFTNDGTAPLVITRTRTSCSCVRVSYPKKPVPPGERGVITVTYEVRKKEPGVFYKVIEIFSNTPEKRTNLIVKGNAVE